MTTKEIFVQIMEIEGVTAPQLERRLGLTRNTIFSRLKGTFGKCLKTNTACQMARALDYKIVVMPADSKVPSGAYVIEEDAEE